MRMQYPDKLLDSPTACC